MPLVCTITTRARGGAETPARSFVAVLGVALLVRLLYWALATPDYVPESDALHYFGIAQNVADGQGIAYSFPQTTVHATAFRPPVYPGLLGAVFWVFGPSIVLGRIVSLVLGLAVVGLTMAVVGELDGRRRTVLVSGLIVAVFPALVANDVALLAEPLSLALLLTTALLLLRGEIIAAGLVTGLLVLSRTSGQFVLPALAVWVLWRFGWRQTLRFAAMALVVLVPWVVRNWVQVGTPVLATSNGFNLAAVYSEPAWEENGFVDAVYNPAFREYRLLQFDEAEWDAALRDAAMTSLGDHPELLVRVPARNLLPFVELKPWVNEGPETMDGRNITVRDLAAPLVPAVAVAGTIGLWRRRADRRVLLLAGLAAYFFLGSLFTVAPPRLRAPVDLVWCIGAGLLAGERWPARRSEAEPAERAEVLPAT
jgi:4-amino-4-deoxy-L-arabinose transferase-like glycosyltransferase